MRSFLTKLSLFPLKTGDISNTSQSVVIHDIGLENNSIFVMRIQGSNISGTRIALFSKEQYKEHRYHLNEFCLNNFSDSFIHFTAPNVTYNEWKADVPNRGIYHPIVFNCNSENLNYTFFFISGHTFLDMRENKMLHITAAEIALYISTFTIRKRNILDLFSSSTLLYLFSFVPALFKLYQLYESRENWIYLARNGIVDQGVFLFLRDDLLSSIIPNSMALASLASLGYRFCLIPFKSEFLYGNAQLLSYIQSYSLWVVLTTHNKDIFYIFAIISLVLYSIYIYLLKKMVTPLKYAKAMSIDGNYIRFFSLSFYFMKRSVWIIRLCQLSVILLLPFDFSYNVKYIMLSWQYLVICALNSWDFNTLVKRYDRKVNNCDLTDDFKELFLKIEKCKRSLRWNKPCPETEAECNDLVQKFLDYVQPKTDLGKILEKELDFIHSRNLSLITTDKDSIHEMKNKRNLSISHN